MNNRKQLTVIDGETLMDARLPRISFCIDTLLPKGIAILGGAPKIGKSWMVLDIALHVAKGEPIWNLQTTRGAVLYLALEDTQARLRERIDRLTDDATNNIFFATAARTIANGLCEEIQNFIGEHPDTTLIIIDTFQIVRNNNIDTSYANDYDELRRLKALADKNNITILLVHHLRKQGDRDPLNKLSGTTGISGSADAVFVLDVSKRNARGATLFCTGRDIETRELELTMNKESCAWELLSDSLEHPEKAMPGEMQKLIEYIKSVREFRGGNTEFTDAFNLATGESISPRALKQMMNRWRYQLEDADVYFKSSRSNGQRFIDIRYCSPSAIRCDGSDVCDENTMTRESYVPSVPCVPADEVANGG